MYRPVTSSLPYRAMIITSILDAEYNKKKVEALVLLFVRIKWHIVIQYNPLKSKYPAYLKRDVNEAVSRN